MRPRWSLALAVPMLSCAAATPAVDSNYVVASRYVFRGVPKVEGAVLQGDTSVGSALGTDAALTATAWTSVDLTGADDDAAGPSSTGGKISEVDFVVDYTRTFGASSLSLGGVSYNFPNVGLVSTTEAYGSLCLGGLPLAPTLTAYYDFDEVEGLYVRAGVSHTWTISASLALDLGLDCGWMDEAQGAARFGVEAAGLADLVASGALSMPIAEHWAATLGVFASDVLDPEFADALDAAELDAENVWAAISLGMTY